uniref:Uncharacterized protein n=1 Tax=Glossina palpalis gambiensis TaxID=67801 RepID=A0A1B0BZV1_9MUSC
MGCSPSAVARPNDANTTAITADETIGTGHEKNGNLFYCIKIRRSRLRRCSLQNGCDTSIQVGGLGSDRAAANGEDLCNQALLNPMQTKNEANYEKISSRKKDSIVTVAAFGNFTHRVVKRATGGK